MFGRCACQWVDCLDATDVVGAALIGPTVRLGSIA